MEFFPAFLNLQGRSCLVVGAGEVALRKVQRLLAAGASIKVVAPDAQHAILNLAADGRLQYFARRFAAGDVAGHRLVVAATNDATVQRAVYVAAETAGVLCNSVDDIDNCSFITPAIVDRSPLVIAISSAGAAPVLARKVRARLEAMLPASIGRLAALARDWRARVRQQLHDSRQRRRFWEWFFDGRLAAAVHTHRATDELLGAALANAKNTIAPGGSVSLVGAGPGDPDLLTLRALQVMQQADVIVHDRLVSDEVLALTRRDAEKLSVGKMPGCQQNSQDSINALLVGLANDGKRVCRLKGGDPFIFGRGGEEAAALAEAGVPCEIVPGITAAAGCAAAAGIPLTHRDHSQSVVLVTGHGKHSVDRLDWASLARDRQTLAVYMAVRRFDQLTRRLVEHGRPPETPIAIVENGTTIRQRVVRGRLGQLAMLAEAHAIASPAMLFIGEVAALNLGGAAVEPPFVAPVLRESAIPMAVVTK